MVVVDAALRRLVHRWTPASRQAAISRRWQQAYIDRVMFVDLIAGGVAGAIAYIVRFPAAGAYNYLATSAACPALWLIAVASAGAYDEGIIGLGSEEFQRIVRALIG